MLEWLLMPQMLIWAATALVMLWMLYKPLGWTFASLITVFSVISASGLWELPVHFVSLWNGDAATPYILGFHTVILAGLIYYTMKIGWNQPRMLTVLLFFVIIPLSMIFLVLDVTLNPDFADRTVVWNLGYVLRMAWAGFFVLYSSGFTKLRKKEVN